MKDMKIYICVIVAIAITTMDGFAQSQTYFYNNLDMFNRTIAAIPGGGYAASETVAGSGSDYAIHFTIYDQAGNIIHEQLIDEPDVLERNVDLLYCVAGGNSYFLITALHQIHQPQILDAKIALIKLDMGGNIVQQTLVKSNNLNYPGLYPLDATYDANQEIFVICGTAAPLDGYHHEPSRTTQKQAFVTKVDANFNPIDIRYYNSDVNGGASDHDIATRIVVTNSNDYYVMGSENVDKGSGDHVAGIRNMLIDENNLGTIWSSPITLNRNSSQENSVDMLEITTNNGPEFAVLVNSTDVSGFTTTAKWWLLRINPSNGNSIYNNLETISPISYAQPFPNMIICLDIGYSLHQGNKPNEIVVSGIKLPTDNRQCNTMAMNGYISLPEAVPFSATVNLNSYPTTFIQHVEYYSIALTSQNSYWGQEGGALYINYPIATNAGGVVYWQINFLGKFMARQAPGAPYGLITNCGNIGVTKFLDVNSNTLNGCDDVRCNFVIPETQMLPIYPNVNLSETPDLPLLEDAYKNYLDIAYSNHDECSNGYYKPGKTMSVNNLTVSDIMVHPNPATNYLTITLPAVYMDKELHATLVDLTGKLIVSFGNNTVKSTTTRFQLPNNMANGLYVLNLSSGGINKQFKVTVLK